MNPELVLRDIVEMMLVDLPEDGTEPTFPPAPWPLAAFLRGRFALDVRESDGTLADSRRATREALAAWLAA